MTKHIPFTAIYLLLTAAVVIASWTMTVYGHEVTQSLLSGEGVRWWVRSLLANYVSAPLGESLLVLLTAGALRRCGPWRWSRALMMSAVVFGLLTALVVWGVMGGNLLSATASWNNSPLQKGWLPLLALVVCTSCVCYGLANGTFQCSGQVAEALASEVKRCAPFFLTLFVAAQLVAVTRWSGLLVAAGAGDGLRQLLAAVVYWLPLVCQFFRKQK